MVLAGGVLEMQQLGVQGETGKDGAFLFLILGEFEIAFEGGEQDGAGVAIEFVADDGMTESLHMDTDLVGAAGVDAELHEGVESEVFENLIVGERGLAIAIDDHGACLGGMFHDGKVDAAAGLCEAALDETLIKFFDVAVFKGLREEFVRGFVLGKDDDAAGVAVEPVDGKDVAVFLAQCSLQRGLFAFAVGDAEHTGGFIDGDESIVLEQNFEFVHTNWFCGVAGSGSRINLLVLY